MTELEKWLAIREMVKEKYFELRKAIYLISTEYRQVDVELAKKRISEVSRKIRSRFLSDDMKELKKDWLDNISAVDLFHVYNYLNKVLRCFYYHVPVNFEVLTKNNDMVIDYKMHRTGDMERSNNDIYKKFYNNLKQPDFEIVDKYFSNEKDNSTIQFTGKPKSKTVPIIDLYNMHFRRSVLTHLMEDAVTRYERTNNVNASHDIDKIAKEFRLYSHKDLGVVTPIDHSVENFYDEESFYNEVRKEVVGVDHLGHPVVKINGILYDCNNEEIVGSVFINRDLEK